VTSVADPSFLVREQQSAYLNVKGGIAFPIAGLVYWLFLAGVGFVASDRLWALVAFMTSGMIFPLGLGIGKILKTDLLKPFLLSGVFGPALVGMLVVLWSIAIPAFFTAPQLVPLILAVGMGAHWPVIGWAYGRPRLYGAHLLVRSAAAVLIWVFFRDLDTVLIPLAVAAAYGGTIFAIAFDVRRLRSV